MENVQRDYATCLQSWKILSNFLNLNVFSNIIKYVHVVQKSSYNWIANLFKLVEIYIEKVMSC
jgi:hypothetical protein